MDTSDELDFVFLLSGVEDTEEKRAVFFLGYQAGLRFCQEDLKEKFAQRNIKLF